LAYRFSLFRFDPGLEIIIIKTGAPTTILMLQHSQGESRSKTPSPIRHRLLQRIASTLNLPGALRAPAFGCFCAASHLDSLSVDKSICYLAPGIMQVSPCGFAGDSQSFCRLFLFKSFEVDKPD
jgi:hypothetical protein